MNIINMRKHACARALVKTEIEAATLLGRIEQALGEKVQ